MDVELFLSVLMLAIGTLTLAVRNRPNPFVGVRFGYTYLSKEAWRKANTFAGIYCIVLGLCFLVVSLTVELPSKDFTIAYLLSIVPMTVITYKIAKESYEKEDMASPVNETKPMMRFSIRRTITLELIPLVVYLVAVALLWNKVPETVAIHFGFDGRPDVYVGRTLGIVAIPVAMMLSTVILTALIQREPLILKFPASSKFMIPVQVYIALVSFSILLYNVGEISGMVSVAVSLIGAITLVVFLVRAHYI